MDFRLEILDYELSLVENFGDDKAPEKIVRENSKKYFVNLIPENHIKFSPEGYIRYNRLGKLSVNGAKIRANSGANYVFSKINVSIDFLGKLRAKNMLTDSAASADFGFGKSLKSLIQNYADLQLYSDPNPPVAKEIAGDNWSPMANAAEKFYWVKISAVEEGFTEIGFKDLQDAGISPAECTPSYFHIYNSSGEEVPTYIFGGDSPSFTQKDFILFYAEKSESRFSSKNIFWLSYNTKKKGLRIEEADSGDKASKRTKGAQKHDSYMCSLQVGDDNSLEINAGNFLSIKDMKWVYGKLSSKEKLSMDFDLPGIMPSKNELSVKFSFFIIHDTFIPGDSVKITMNDFPPFEFVFSNPESNIFYENIPPRSLFEKGNHVEFEFIPAKEKKESSIFFDFLEASYLRKLSGEKSPVTFETNIDASSTARLYSISSFTDKDAVAFDITDKHKPRCLASEITANNELSLFIDKKGNNIIHVLNPQNDKLAVASIKKIKQQQDIKFNKNEGADYLIIYHENFTTAIKPLVDLKTSMGLKVAAFDVETLYDKYTGGMESPLAIKRFLKDALLKWENPKPTYVLLIGDCTSDYRGEAKNKVINYVPGYSMNAEMKTSQDKWTSDNWFTYITEEDIYSDFMIGRISVNNLTDAENAINKICDYQKKNEIGSWQGRIGFVSDNGYFEGDVKEILKDKIPPEYENVFIPLSEMPWEDNFYLPQEVVDAEKAKVSPTTTKSILNLFNSGASLIWYFGHGSPNIWADERIWFGGDSENSDNLLLNNYQNLPFVMNMTCNSGAIDYPVPRWNICISEDMMRLKNGGAIGLFVPSGPGFTSAHHVLSNEICDAIFKNNIKRLGEIVFSAETRFLSSDPNQDIAKMYILLGDPSLELKIAQNKVQMKINKGSINWEQGDKVEVSYQHAEQISGIARVSLFDPEKYRVGETKEVAVKNGGFTESFMIPPKAKRGRWFVQAYIKSPEKDWDAVGAASFVNDVGIITVAKFERKITPETELTSPKVVLAATLKNISSLEVKDAPIDLTSGVGTPIRKTVSIKPYSEAIVLFETQLKSSLTTFFINVPQKKMMPDPSFEIKDTMSVSVPFLKKESKYDIALSPQEITFVVDKMSGKEALKLSVPVYNVGYQTALNIKVTITYSGNPDKVEKEIARIAPGAKEIADFVIDKGFACAKSENYTIRLTFEKSSDEVNKADNESVFQYSPFKLPDLVIEKNAMRLEPANPPEGYTAYVHVTIKNTGYFPARDFMFGVYTEDPKGKETEPEKIKSMADENDYFIKYLAPQSQIEKVVRWDPLKNIDVKNLWAAVNPKQNIPEISEKNNFASIPVKILRKGSIKPIGIRMKPQSAEEKAQNEATLEVSFTNDGDVPLNRVVVVFFSQMEQTPENEIGRVIVDEVKPNTPAVASLKWKYHPGVSYQPTSQLFIKGSTRRVTSFEEKK